MIQLPTLPPDTPSVRIPLPSPWERLRDTYLHDAGEKLVVFLVIAALLYAAARLARRQVDENIEEVNRRHALRKWISYGMAALLVIAALALFADALERLGTIVAVVLAGLAVALQDVVKSVVGWVYLSGRSGVRVGSRVEVEGVMGDVIDIGLLKTTLAEVSGSRVFGEQSTGRLITVPNSWMISARVSLSAAYNPFVWEEVRIAVPFGSDWEYAERVLYAVGNELHAEIAAEVERGFGAMERRFAFKYGKTTPIVYASLGDRGVELTLRFLTHVRRQRAGIDRVSRAVLQAFAERPEVRLAYPAYRIYREDRER